MSAFLYGRLTATTVVTALSPSRRAS